MTACWPESTKGARVEEFYSWSHDGTVEFVITNAPLPAPPPLAETGLPTDVQRADNPMDLATHDVTHDVRDEAGDLRTCTWPDCPLRYIEHTHAEDLAISAAASASASRTGEHGTIDDDDKIPF